MFRTVAVVAGILVIMSPVAVQHSFALEQNSVTVNESVSRNRKVVLKEPRAFYPAQKTIRQAKVLKLTEIEVRLDTGTILRPSASVRNISLNGIWKCSGLTNSKSPYPANIDLDTEYMKPSYNDSSWDNISVPLDWYRQYKSASKMIDGKSRNPYVKGWYRKTFTLTDGMISNKRVVLNFGVIGYEARLFVNGKEAGDHHGDFTPWEIDISDFVVVGENSLAIRVLSDFGDSFSAIEKVSHVYGSQWSTKNIKGGLWQDVNLTVEPEVRFVRALVSPDLSNSCIAVDYLIENNANLRNNYRLRAVVYSAMKKSGPKVIAEFDAGQIGQIAGSRTGCLNVKLKQPEFWTLEDPYLYYLTLCLMDENKIISSKTVRFGFRDFKIRDRAFYLNGDRIYLFGENVASVLYGGVGINKKDEGEKILKVLSGYKSLGYNIIRNAHMPVVPEMLEIADEIGLMIYNEWAWCFSSKIIEDEFEERNLAELQEWVYRDYNHPSVVMWSCANEVTFKNDEAVGRQLDKQVALIRKLDKSARPVGSFSGLGTWSRYGKAKRKTDFIDLHDYCGLAAPGWTKWEESFNKQYETTASIYKTDSEFNMPYIVWECVGFSWGNLFDPEFKLNDIEKYVKYAEKKPSWANPNGIGFAGVIGLEGALDPNRGISFGKKIYGKRIIEQIRQDLRVQGVAPWFTDYTLKEATVWTQPVFCGIRSENGVPIRNVFIGDKYQQKFFLVNSSRETLEKLHADIYLVMSNNESGGIPLVTFELPTINPWEKYTQNIVLSIPKLETPSRGQLRIVVRAGKREVSRNFYGLYIQSKSILTDIPQQTRCIAVFKTDSPKSTKLNQILNELGIYYDLIDKNNDLLNYHVVIVPPSIESKDVPKRKKLMSWVKSGGVLVELEQARNIYDADDQTGVNCIIYAPQTFVDIAIPEHPLFENLDQKAFDTWNNPDHGYVINYALEPFTLNALAVRMSHLGGTAIANAVSETRFNKGRLLQSQLSAINLWKLDSAATTYLRNLLVYVVSGKLYAGTLPNDIKSDRITIVPERLFAVNLKPYVNRSFTDKEANDGKGGWTDQGDNDFKMMPTGKIDCGDLFFDIINPAKNSDRSCIVLKGGKRGDFPSKSEPIKVGQAVSHLFFLHTCAWGANGAHVGHYKINYTNGKTKILPLIAGETISDWWRPDDVEKAVGAIKKKNIGGHEVGLSMLRWDNPDPKTAIDSIQLVSAGDAVPVLIAVSGQKPNPNAITIYNAENKQEWTIKSWKDGGDNGTNKPEVKILERSSDEADVFRGERSLKVTMASNGNNGKPLMYIRFDSQSSKGTYNYLTLWVKPLTYCVLKIVIPAKNWKDAFSTTVPLGVRKKTEWQQIRLSLTEDMGMEQGFDFKKSNGELFIYSAVSEKDIDGKDKMKFILDEIILE